jgi:hypothetical protein
MGKIRQTNLNKLFIFFMRAISYTNLNKLFIFS